MIMTIMDLFGRNNNTNVNETAEKKISNRLYDSVQTNIQTVGSKKYASLPEECLEIDPAWQRTETYNKRVLNELIAHFDINKMDTIIVSVHRDTKKWVVIDGFHRVTAGRVKGITEFPCEIKDFGDDPVVRERKEIEYFVGQNDFVDHLSLLDKHKANVRLGVKANVALQAVVDKTEGVTLKNNIERVAKGRITGFKQAIAICNNYGQDHFQNVVDVIIGAKWNQEPSGFGADALKAVSFVLWTHRNNKKVKAELARILVGKDPVDLFNEAVVFYKGRRKTTARAMYLEDLICSSLNIPRLIDPEEEVRFNPAM
jgi:hypothetical protein